MHLKSHDAVPYHLSRHVYASSLMLLHVTCIFVTSIPKHIKQLRSNADDWRLEFPPYLHRFEHRANIGCLASIIAEIFAILRLTQCFFSARNM